MAPISFPRKGSRLLTLVPTFYVLKEQRGKRALVRASVWRFNGSSKGFAPARPQVVEQQTSGSAVLGSHEGKGFASVALLLSDGLVQGKALVIQDRVSLIPRPEAVRCISHDCFRCTRTLSTVHRMGPCPCSTVLVGRPTHRCCAAKRYG